MVASMGVQKRQNTKLQPDTVNAHGTPAFNQELYQQYLQMLLTNVASQTYYASAEENKDAAISLHTQMSETDPYFMGQAAVYARTSGKMRLQPIVALAVLSKVNPRIAGKIFSKIILTPGDLADLFALFLDTPANHICHREALGNRFTGFARHVVTYLQSLSEYHVIKYQSGGSTFALRDILRMIRPKSEAPTSKQSLLFRYVTQRDSWKELYKKNVEQFQELLPQVTALEALKAATTDEDRIQWIQKGRLPHEVVTGSVPKMTVTLWQHLIPNLPYFALLRNLVTLMRNNAIETQEQAQFIADKLSNKANLVQAKVLPFQIKAAINKFQETKTPANNGLHAIILNGLQDAFENSVDNVIEFNGTVVIAPDISGSMNSALTGASMRYSDVAAIFSAAIFKKNKQAHVLPFDDRVYNMELNPRDSLLSLVNTLTQSRGGTRLSAPLDYLLRNKIAVDNYISITDSEEWVGDTFFNTLKEYRKFCPNTKYFLIRLDTAGRIPTPPNYPNVYHIYGWGDNVLKTIGAIANLSYTQVDEVKQIELG